MSGQQQWARVLFLIRIPGHRTGEFLRAYESIRYRVAEVDGYLADQVCQSTGDPEQWLITSEWESLERFETWERGTAHRELIRPMRECMSEARSIRFVVHLETRAPAVAEPEPAARG